MVPRNSRLLFGALLSVLGGLVVLDRVHGWGDVDGNGEGPLQPVLESGARGEASGDLGPGFEVGIDGGRGVLGASPLGPRSGAPVCGVGCGDAQTEAPSENLGVDAIRSAWEALAWSERTAATSALESLLFHGDEVHAWLVGATPGDPHHGDQDRGLQAWLRSEVAQRSVELELRVVDGAGRIRLAFGPVPVGLGEKHHVTPVHLDGLQTPDTSGRVERVGVDHYWLRW